MEFESKTQEKLQNIALKPADKSVVRNPTSEVVSEPKAFELPVHPEEHQFEFFKVLHSEDLTLIRLWLKHKNSIETVKAYGGIMSRFFKKFPSIRIKEIRPEHISAFQMSMEAKKPSTLNLAKACLSSLFDFGIKYRVLDQNPTLLVKTFKSVNRRQDKVLELEEVQRMISFETNLRNHIMLHLAFSLGLRVSELINVKVSDFREISIKGKPTAVLYVLGKGTKERHLNIGKKLWKKVGKYIEEKRLSENAYLFENQKQPGKSISRIQAWNIFKSAGNKAGLSKIPSPHYARHFAAAKSLEAGMNLTDLQKNLGHSNINTTSLYSGLVPNSSFSDFISL